MFLLILLCIKNISTSPKAEQNHGHECLNLKHHIDHPGALLSETHFTKSLLGGSKVTWSCSSGPVLEHYLAVARYPSPTLKQYKIRFRTEKLLIRFSDVEFWCFQTKQYTLPQSTLGTSALEFRGQPVHFPRPSPRTSGPFFRTQDSGPNAAKLKGRLGVAYKAFLS